MTPSRSPGDAWKVVSKSTLYKVCKIFNQRPPPPRVPHTWYFSRALPTRVHHLGEPLVNPLAHLTVHNTLYISQATTQFLLTVERKPAWRSASSFQVPTTTMKAVLLRTGSVPVQSSLFPGSPRVSFGVHDSVTRVFSRDKTSLNSPRFSLHFQNNSQGEVPARRIRRALSESDIIRSESGISKLNGVGSHSFPARIPEEEEEEEEDDNDDEGGPLIVKQKSVDLENHAGSWPEIGIPVEELGFSGGGADGDGSGSFTGGGKCDQRKLAAYYEEMLKLNPGDSLLLRNYGKFLHEVILRRFKRSTYV